MSPQASQSKNYETKPGAWQSKQDVQPRQVGPINLKDFTARLVATHGAELAELADR